MVAGWGGEAACPPAMRQPCHGGGPKFTRFRKQPWRAGSGLQGLAAHRFGASLLPAGRPSRPLQISSRARAAQTGSAGRGGISNIAF
eukprot:7404221-Pyramimonas_sp.AAC.1